MSLSLGFGGSSQSSTTTFKPNAATTALFYPAFNQASALAGQAAKPYTAPLTAGTNATQHQAADLAKANVGAGQGVLGQAVGAASGAATYQPTHVSAGQVSDADLGKYLNPYMSDVVDASLSDIERQRQQAIMAGQGAAAHAGAFGGSRHGVADSLTNEAALRTAASTAAGLRAQGFDRATALAGQDIDRRFAADAANQGADANAAQLRYSGAGLLGNLAAQQHDMGAADALLMNQFGTQQQATDQAALDAAYEEFKRQYQDPFQAYTGLLGSIANLYAGAKQNGSGSGFQWGASGTASYGSPK